MFTGRDDESILEKISMQIVSEMLFHDKEYHKNVWICKRVFVHLFYEQIKLKKEFPNLTSVDINQLIGIDFGSFVHSLGGWQVMRDIVSADISNSLREMTFAQARRGFIVGSILESALSNNGNISLACKDVSEKISIEDKIIITNEFYKLKKLHKYDNPEYLRQNYYRDSCVAHLWAAALNHFQDPGDFADRMHFDVFPFNTSTDIKNSAEGFVDFLECARIFLDKSTKYVTPGKKKKKALIDIDKATASFDLLKEIVSFFGKRQTA